MSKHLVKKLSLSLVLAACSIAPALANECSASPGMLGTARVLTVKPSEFPLVGKLGYGETLRLADHEVVLTFDDGPSPPYTSKILDILASECIKATFFVAGSALVDAADITRRARDEGHTIGSHTYENNNLSEMTSDQGAAEIDKGINAAADALGGRNFVAPFFRAPDTELPKTLERYALSKGLMIWNADVDTEDWNEPNEEEFVKRAISGLEQEGKGILLMRDSQPVTARALRMLIAELKAKKFKVVHVVPDKSAVAASAQ